jgi:hypothetical protein
MYILVSYWQAQIEGLMILMWVVQCVNLHGCTEPGCCIMINLWNLSRL